MSLEVMWPLLIIISVGKPEVATRYSLVTSFKELMRPCILYVAEN